MELVIEATDESGPQSLLAISVAHYGKQNGDAMRDPEMCFELGFHDGPLLLAAKNLRGRFLLPPLEALRS